MKNNNFLKSLKHAFSGIFEAIKNEPNLRFHIVIANLIVTFAYFFKITRVEWGMLCVMIFLVISAELFNTAIENVVDLSCTEYNKFAKFAKDASAGAVLVIAISSILLGVCIFGDVEKIKITLYTIFSNWENLVPCAFLGILDMIFLFGFKKGNDKR